MTSPDATSEDKPTSLYVNCTREIDQGKRKLAAYIRNAEATLKDYSAGAPGFYADIFTPKGLRWFYNGKHYLSINNANQIAGREEMMFRISDGLVACHDQMCNYCRDEKWDY